jgi:hypothetical protein
MRCDLACAPVFARHETFHPRYGWVKKAYDAAEKDANLFNADNAVVELGVGKNMVRSIRFWGLAFHVLCQAKQANNRVPLAVPSTIGRTMFADDGWDPYGELADTHWLLHWWLLAPGSMAPVWWLAFNEFPGVQFSDEQLGQFVMDRVRDWADPHPSSVRKDVSCLLRMYATGAPTRASFDDMIDCPTRDLRLITPTTEKGVYRFVVGPKPTLPPAVAAFAALDFVARTDMSVRTVTVSRLATEPGGPGRAFKLTESALVDLLERAAQTHGEIEMTSQAGVPQLAIGDEPAIAGTELLYDHFRSRTKNVRFPGTALIAGPDASGPASGVARSARA